MLYPAEPLENMVDAPQKTLDEPSFLPGVPDPYPQTDYSGNPRWSFQRIRSCDEEKVTRKKLIVRDNPRYLNENTIFA
jgi:hypothetical protein